MFIVTDSLFSVNLFTSARVNEMVAQTGDLISDVMLAKKNILPIPYMLL